jgi:hypothetical protein
MGKKVVVKMKKRNSRYIDYEVKIMPFMERSTKIYGYIRGNKDQIKQTIRRALRAKRPLPKHIEEFVINVIKHVLSNFNNDKVEKASICMRDADGGFEISVCVSIYYGIQGIAELSVVIRFPNGWHMAEKTVVMLDGKLKDHTDRLMREMTNVAEYAYNVYIEAARHLRPEQRHV